METYPYKDQRLLKRSPESSIGLDQVMGGTLHLGYENRLIVEEKQKWNIA